MGSRDWFAWGVAQQEEAETNTTTETATSTKWRLRLLLPFCLSVHVIFRVRREVPFQERQRARIEWVERSGADHRRLHRRYLIKSSVYSKLYYNIDVEGWYQNGVRSFRKPKNMNAVKVRFDEITLLFGEWQIWMAPLFSNDAFCIEEDIVEWELRVWLSIEWFFLPSFFIISFSIDIDIFIVYVKPAEAFIVDLICQHDLSASFMHDGDEVVDGYALEILHITFFLLFPIFFHLLHCFSKFHSILTHHI